MRSLLVALAAVLLIPLPAHASSDGGDPSPLPRLKATHGAKAKVVNHRGAQVLLRGVNVNQLGEYYQANPTLDPTIPLTRDDFRDIARTGFNSVRLIVSWSRLEPTPGAYDTDYVAQVREAVEWAAAYDLYVVLDMHQDAYGIAVDTPQDVTCPSGTSPNNGWDGAPAWATITDGASTCRPGERELAPADRAEDAGDASPCARRAEHEGAQEHQPRGEGEEGGEIAVADLRRELAVDAGLDGDQAARRPRAEEHEDRPEVRRRVRQGGLLPRGGSGSRPPVETSGGGQPSRSLGCAESARASSVQ